MNQQPDKFFRDKLEHYQHPAPSGAWDKIEAGLEKKTTRGIWWRIAASLLLVALVSFTLWKTTHTATDVPALADQTQPAPSTTIQPDQAKPQATPSETMPEKTTEAHIRKELAQTKKQTSSHPEPQHRKNISVPNQSVVSEQTVAQNAAAPKDQQAPTLDVVSEPLTNNTATVATATPDVAPVVAESAPKKITITVTAIESEGYLDKKALADATSGEKKSSTLQKLLKKADDLKNNQDPFGELRQKKNEILALNFKSEKRGQNK
ncbi:hypothetical protein [Chryseolinea lacunae]|uniref:Uncharacterized protein n=1 Tax=Chryseolinea lacunae TaxID=2801331 RepID=A0ABS1KTL2_9BACT|nr:hypothetical protein [Chryseolinea lacunae]MBL0742799.1 hypothetical protein [Chryseolinea lacunae]